MNQGINGLIDLLNMINLIFKYSFLWKIKGLYYLLNFILFIYLFIFLAYFLTLIIIYCRNRLQNYLLYLFYLCKFLCFCIYNKINVRVTTVTYNNLFFIFFYILKKIISYYTLVCETRVNLSLMSPLHLSFLLCISGTEFFW